MKYSEVLHKYQPIEIGDFMRRYSINGREYIVYSPVEGELSCLELYHFKELNPFQLSIFIKQFVVDIEIEEFRFDKICSKEKLITFLFDVKQENGRKLRRVSGKDGYLLYEVKQSRKVRNIYQFSIDSEEFELLFDNEICYTSINDDISSNIINVCWNPIVFYTLESQKNDIPTYLLSSVNPILCSQILNIAQLKEAKIKLWNYGFMALVFLSNYLKYVKAEKAFDFYSDDKIITLSMVGWHPLTLVKFISKVQKKCNEKFKQCFEYQETDQTIYQLESVNGVSFVTFPIIPVAINAILDGILQELQLKDIFYLEL